MSINTHIEKVKERLREGAFINEASVSQGILLPVLNELGWPVFDTTVVVPESPCVRLVVASKFF